MPRRLHGKEIPMTYSSNRPQGYEGQGDSHLPGIVKTLRRKLSETQGDFAHDTLRLPSGALGDLASILVDFAEDLHAGIGIWAAYERYNTEFFSAALPLTPAGNGGGSGLHSDRFRHFLWILYPALIDNLTISPTHQDLHRIADAACALLSDAFAEVSKDSGVQAFLQSSNDHGWDVKRKLVWLGTHSFIFRTMFACYMEEQPPGGSDIPHVDDFVCQECTRWSGLGAIDILAGALDIPDDDRKDLRSWYERHAAPYKIESAGNDVLHAVNLVSDQPYRIRIDMRRHPFRRGQVVFGSLVP
jgi:hypothetical protein